MNEVDNKLFCLDSSYSTTRRLASIIPVIENPPEAKFQSRLFLPPNAGRRGEGGLRTQGLFKVGSSQGLDGEESNHTDARPLITVITAVCNGGNTLEQSILSVLNQSYDNLEYIIIDGGSEDGTLDIIRKYEQAIDYWVSEPDKGIYDAWNKGVGLALGDWVAFLGADDTYLAGAIHAYVESLADQQDQRWEYLSSRVNLTTGTKMMRTVGQRWRWKTFRRYMSVAHVGSLHSRSLFERYGLFDTSYKISGDYEFLLRAGSDLHATYLDSVTVNMGIGGASDNNLLGFREKERAQVTTGGRNALLSRIEGMLAVVKWKLRKRLWY